MDLEPHAPSSSASRQAIPALEDAVRALLSHIAHAPEFTASAGFWMELVQADEWLASRD